MQRRFPRALAAINRGVARDGAYYLFTLRLVPLFPFFVINLAMALTPMPTWRFYWVSQLGMLAGTAVYVNAGTQLAQIREPGDVLSPALIGSFVLLGLFPWLARGVLTLLRRRRALAGFPRPRQFDNNLLVIGAGSAGLVAAYVAATVRARVTLVEAQRMGGDCLNTGCVPSKTLIHSARMRHHLRRAEAFGLRDVDGEVDFAAVMRRVRAVIATIEPHDSVQRYTSLGVNCVAGRARLVSPWEVEIQGETGTSQRLTARHIVIATGARPAVPDIPGLATAGYVTSDSVWQLEALPQRLVVLGGGPVGCELAQAFARLGSAVTLIVRSRLLPREDEEVARELAACFESEGIRVLQYARVEDAAAVDGDKRLQVRMNQSDVITVSGDQLLVAVGRQANTEGLGLEAVNVACNADGTVAVDDCLQSSCPTVFACGDVAGPYQYTHAAAHQAGYAAVNALFGMLKRFRVDYAALPHATYCDPEVARVGLNETEARAQQVDYEVTRYALDDLDRAIVDGETRGFVKILTQPGRDRILGVTIVGHAASELLAEYTLAMNNNLGLNKVFNTIHSYPTFGEANRFAAGNWKQAHRPERILQWLQRLHALRR